MTTRHDPDNALLILGVFMLCVLVVGIIIEGIIFYRAYTNADTVQYAWWGCAFTEIRSSGEREQNISRTCTENGVLVNCTNFRGVAWKTD